VSPPPFLRLRSRLPPFLSPGPGFRHRGREEGTLLQVTRAVHLGVERERVWFFSLVAAGRRERAP